MATQFSKITVNWKNKNERRGLTETAVETMMKIGIKHKDEKMVNATEDLLEKYYGMLYKTGKDENYSFEKEVEILSKFVNVIV